MVKKIVKKKVRKKAIPKGFAPLAKSVKRTTGRGKTHDRLRIEAMAVYVMDMDGASVKDLHKDPRFKTVHLDTLHVWCNEDHWVDLRKEALAKVRAKLSKELAFRLSENMMREVKDLIDLREVAWVEIKNPLVETKSREGMMKVFLDMNKRLAEIAELVKQGALDDMGRKIPAASETKIEYKVEDLREAAKMLTAKNRSALRARAAMQKQLEAKNEVS